MILFSSLRVEISVRKIWENLTFIFSIFRLFFVKTRPKGLQMRYPCALAPFQSFEIKFSVTKTLTNKLEELQTSLWYPQELSLLHQTVQMSNTWLDWKEKKLETGYNMLIKQQTVKESSTYIQMAMIKGLKL